MKMSTKEMKVKENSLVLCCDVGKASISAFAESETEGQLKELVDVFDNKTAPIRSKVAEVQKVARAEFGLDHVHVICEPTGGFERRFLEIARSMGCTTSYVSGETTSKLRVCVNNDPEKSDEKDPRIINVARKAGALLTHRILPESYRHLRLLANQVEDLNNKVAELRNQLSATLVQIWPDYDREADFLFSNAGQALVKVYGCDPQMIVRHGYDRFRREIRAYSRAWEKTIKELYASAEASTLHLASPMEQKILTRQVKDLHQDWRWLSSRKKRRKEELDELYKSLPEYEQLRDVPVSDYQMAKLVAETGPLRDFTCPEQLMRYAGLNVCRKASGKYVGQSKISKKGRCLLRKILYQIAFSSLIGKGKIYGEFYQKKKKELKIYKKTMVCIMRKFLKMTLGVYKSPIAFDPKRIQICESKYKAVS